MSKRELLADFGYDNAIVFENPDYDAAICGVSQDGQVIYDYELMVQSLMQEDGMTEEEAEEFIEFNTIRSLPYAGEGAPIIMYRMEE